MSGNQLERAWQLYSLDRYEEAIRMGQEALAADPDDAQAHTLISLSHCDQGNYDPSEEAARRAIHLAPDAWTGHYALAYVLVDRRRYAEAHRAIDEALRIEPDEPGCYAIKSAIFFEQEKWERAREQAEEGLALDPEHDGCRNLLGRSLIQLGRGDEADQVLREVLSDRADSPGAHTGMGLMELHRGDHKQALVHFEEALRGNPNNESARQGLIAALKARHPIYKVMLAYFLWMSRLSPGVRWSVIIGAVLLIRVLRTVAKEKPELSPYIIPVVLLYFLFVFLSWTAERVFNLLLFLNRHGRLSLNQEEKRVSLLVGFCFLLAGAAGVTGLATGEPSWYSGLIFLLLVIPISGTADLEAGWPRKLMVGLTLLLALLGGAGVALAVAGGGEPGPSEVFLGLSGLGCLLSTWVMAGLSTVTPER